MVDLRCPELADLETRLAGELVPVDDELYGLWEDREHGGPSWWYCNYQAWFTPNARIAHAQRLTLIKRFNFDIENITVCRLGPYGEPLELE